MKMIVVPPPAPSWICLWANPAGQLTSLPNQPTRQVLSLLAVGGIPVTSQSRLTSQEGEYFVVERVRDCVAHPFDPGSLRASAAGTSPQKKRSPLRGGGRGWQKIVFLTMAILGLLSPNIAANAGAAFENGLGARAYSVGQAMSGEVSDSTVGAGLSGIIHTTRNSGRAVATGETSEYAAHGFFLGAGTRVWDKLNAGITLKYLTEALSGYQATGFGVDLGLQYPVFSWLDAGLTVQNLIVPQMAWNTASGIQEPVVMAIRPGIAVQLSREVRVMSQVDWRESRGTTLLWGAEYWPMDMLVVRGGYNSREFALGTGVKLGGLSVDMTWSTAWTESVPDTYRVGMGYGW